MEVNDVKALSLDELLERAGDIGYAYAEEGKAVWEAESYANYALICPTRDRFEWGFVGSVFEAVRAGYWDGMQESEHVSGSVFSALSEGGYE